MMEEPLSRGVSPSGGSSLSGGGEVGAMTNVTLEERLLDVTSRHSLNLLRTPPAKKAKRVRFFRNGDKFYTGVVMAVTPERYRSFDSLATDLTRALISNVTLPNGVRAIYTMDGRKVVSVGDLEDGKCYVCSGQGETFKKVEYSASKVRRGSSLSGLPQSPAGTGRLTTSVPIYVQAKIVTLIRHGTKPRRVLRLLLNKRNAPSLEHALEAITEAVKLDSGAVRKVYTLSGVQVTTLEQFFQNEEIFLAYGTDKLTQEDFELDFEESKAVQSFRRGHGLTKRYGGPMPPMPKKSGKKALSIPQVRTPSPVFVQLPLPLRMHFVAGHVIGDGNFAVVRHCIQRRTGVEYALKIIDKYKCQGQGTMLDSEIAIMKQVCHPNIISLIAEQETTDQLFLVMELVKGGDLFDAIAAATKFSEAEASVMITHLVSALAYLHAHHIVHRDVKPENLLVEMEGSRVTCLKLGDFGLAQLVREPLYTVCGTPTYVAPEILAEVGYGLKIDVWAAGVIMYILLCGFPPFVSPENEQEELFERILSGHYEYTAPYWDSVSESAKQLISNMLQVQPELRFSAEDVLDHPWLASFLGGEQATAAAAEPAEQYWHKQRKPIRQATYDFSYDYGTRRQESSNNTGIDGQYAYVAPTSSLSDFVFTQGHWSDFPKSQKTYCNVSLSASDTHINEIDFLNGYCNANEPQSLDTACLEDIRAMTKSMHDLMNNIGQMSDADIKERPNSALNSVPSTNGASIHPSSNNKNGKLTAKERNCGSSMSEIATRNESPKLKSNSRSSSVRNGHSLSDVRGRISAGSKSSNQRQKYGSGSSIEENKKVRVRKSTHAKSVEKLESLKSTHRDSSDCSEISNNGISPMSTRYSGKQTCSKISWNKAPQTSNNNASKFTKFAKTRHVDTVDLSTRSNYDGKSSSDNDIETSDSFVNIQFARSALCQSSDSSHSIESTDSFENVQFIKFTKSDRIYEAKSSDKTGERERCPNSSTDDKKNVINSSRIQSPSEYSISKSTKKIQNSNQSQKISKSQESASNVTEKCLVKRREKKPSHVSNSTDELSSARNEVHRNKRYSCHTPHVGRRMQGGKDVDERVNQTSSSEYVTKNKKSSSTDELHDVKQKHSNKSKRYSLYYTPQPSRKNYSSDGKDAKNTKKLVNESISQLGSRQADFEKNITETITSSTRKDVKNRKSVLQTTTAASRNRSNKQSIHIKPGIVNVKPTQTKLVKKS
ncbi:uncharacterized protein [Neodiprion pinetum]|uniref:uncharacterized protein n=1 Tax=Neodiprion pinetum TaxID=441929 RepID=UPI001EE01C8F|nr:putative serine/threonine-protein kinase YPL150W isoform X1 [Neodiprion pinetum]